MSIVLDASVALAWCFADEQSAFADRVLIHLRADDAAVPAIWAAEVMNALVIAERRGRADETDIARFRRLVLNLDIHRDDPSMEAMFGPVHELARRFGLSAYDASYLELAARRGLPLATSDERLRRAAAGAGVALFA